MENKERVDSPSSPPSLTHELFGSKESAPPPTGIFASIFPPPSTVMGRKSSTSELVESIDSHSVGSQVWNRYIPDNQANNMVGFTSNKERSFFTEKPEPCPLSSSLYYGGLEDMYMRSSSAQSPGLYSEYKKHGAEDDQNGNSSHCASRGNWWQGSLYY